MNFNKAITKTLLDECKLALQVVADKHGVELIRKSANFSSTDLNMKFQLRSMDKDSDGNQITQESSLFKTLAVSYNLNPDDLGREFNSARGRYKITGLVPRRRKFPIQAVCIATGRGFKFPAHSVRLALARENA